MLCIFLPVVSDDYFCPTGLVGVAVARDYFESRIQIIDL